MIIETPDHNATLADLLERRSTHEKYARRQHENHRGKKGQNRNKRHSHGSCHMRRTSF